MHHYYFFDVDKCLDGFKLIFSFPYFFYPLLGLISAMCYKPFLTRWGNPESINHKARVVAGNWGKWVAIIIYLLPLFDEKDTQGAEHMAYHIYTIKTSLWISFGIILSLPIGLIAWAYYHAKPLIAKSKKIFTHGKSLIDVAPSDL